MDGSGPTTGTNALNEGCDLVVESDATRTFGKGRFSQTRWTF